MFSSATAVRRTLSRLPGTSSLFPPSLRLYCEVRKRNMATYAPGKTVEIPSRGPHTATVIWLHGLGDFGIGWYEPMEEMGISLPGIKFVLPTAPRRPVSINNGLMMTAWYDIQGLADRIDEPFEGVEESSQFIRSLIKNEHDRGIAYDKILLAGFSQGGGLATYTAIRHTPRLAGLCALSTYMPRGPALLEGLDKEAHTLPVFLGHGDNDSMVDVSYSDRGRQWLEAKGFTVQQRIYPGLDHGACPLEMHHVTDFVAQCLKIDRVK
eukprot:comp86186_c0_seq1/m.48461 comp86186_c0_seq1/g.48461  ORF comp86186_c0_seq1/g.48461 comp86186_c0_seq1/m.48461 type:complete len:266 (-) comp86186_c0_seq1:64-861(-)